MASGTINGTTINPYIICKIEWESTCDIANNTSTVVAKLYYRRTDSDTTAGYGAFSVYINGKKHTVTNKYISVSSNWVLAVSGSETITHDTNGSKSITIYARGYIANTSLYDGSLGGETTCSGAATLDTIPRASTIDDASCATRYFDGALTLKYTPKSSGYYNRLTISCSGRSSAVRSVNLGQKTAAQQTWTESLSATSLGNIYSAITDDDHGVLTFTLTTFSDSAYSEQVGTAQSKQLTLYIPQNADTLPTCSALLSPVGSLADQFDGMYVQGKTSLQASITAEGKYGTAVSCSILVAGKKYNSEILAGDGETAVVITATDGRGFSVTDEQTIYVYPYSSPKIYVSLCGRCDASGNLSDAGTYLKIQASRTYSNVDQKNLCDICFRHKTGDGEWSEWIVILAGSAAADSVETQPLLGSLAVDASYQVQVGVIDDIENPVYTTLVIPTDTVHWHRGKDFFAVGKYSEFPGFECAWDARFHKEIYIGEETLEAYIKRIVNTGG